jgi:hypothetical protein
VFRSWWQETRRTAVAEPGALGSPQGAMLLGGVARDIVDPSIARVS